MSNELIVSQAVFSSWERTICQQNKHLASKWILFLFLQIAAIWLSYTYLLFGSVCAERCTIYLVGTVKSRDSPVCNSQLNHNRKLWMYHWYVSEFIA